MNRTLVGLTRPSTPSLRMRRKKGVDARDKRGHDGGGASATNIGTRTGSQTLRADCWRAACILLWFRGPDIGIGPNPPHRETS
jgi:hypothetical protein